MAALCGGLLAFTIACDRPPATPANVTVASVVPPRPESTVVVVTAPWRAVDGAFLLLAGDDFIDATLVPPDALDSLAHGLPQGPALTVDLLGRSGRIGSAVVAPVRPRGCGWPRVRIASRDALADDTHWSVAFAPGVARAVPMDSLERLTRADSVRLVADLARLLSALPDDTVPTFRGLPFSVRGAWTFGAAPGIAGVVAEVHRRVAQEATPLEERLLLIAERDAGPSAHWHAVWWVRAQGTEESVEALDALALLVLGGDPSPTLVAGHEAPDGAWQELVARDASGRWRSRWRSARPPACDEVVK